LHQIGEEIDIWVVEKALGAGGMGSVYRCHNRSAKRILAAIKVLDTSLKKHPSIRARFVREGELLFSLDHPHIVKVRNIRMDADPPYLEMEFVEGESLESRLERGAVPQAELLTLATQLADALVYLHARGIRHRDLKPSNILIQKDGRAKLVDFGIATESDGSTLAEGGKVFGSVAFVPPEWVQPGDLDPAKWDIYALGVCMYEALSGKIAFDFPGSGSASQRFYQVITAKQAHPPLDPGPPFPEALRALVREMTHSDARLRVQTAAEVLRRLKDLSGSTGETTVAETVPPQPTEPRARSTWAEGRPAVTLLPVPARSRWLVLGALAAVGAMAVVGLATAAWWGVGRPPSPRFLEIQVQAASPYHIRLGAEEGRSIPGGLAFGPLEPGTYKLNAWIGADCEQSPSTCGEATLDVAVVGGPDAQKVDWQLPEPSLRPLTLTAPAGKFRVWIGGVLKGEGEEVQVESLPGRLSLRAEAGSCPEKTPPCTPGTGADGCPAGCAVWEGSLDLPWGTGPHRLEVPLPKPVIAAASKPATPPTAARPRQSGVVSNSSLARWLASHPEWQRETATAEGKGDARFLSGWNGPIPPAGKEGAAAVNLNWNLAKAYCGSRGLADLDAEPLQWTESATAPWHEYRQKDGRPAWRRSDGSTSTSVKTGESSSFTGIRCGS
jgi:predicted Ser/Thr protein kinase